MPDAPDSANKITPPFSPLRVQIEPPRKKRRREETPKKPQSKKKGKGEGNSNRGKAVDLLV
ncbi:MAG: hypothetical protein KAS98_00710 [Deltaproteobacteria bacterium]|jgi:hypothetical protein|nr:hypothetical protein [Deltaproteobacteria bacterium]MCK5187642.1 hypothetical protein [Deltaproteobacteria bacterium]MCK5422052.1 hypothetical protein [Deltaproteobacteria bacterium]MCK5514126.1 hypothetical protein [Deltaproteobacteria bacterium]